MRTIITIALVAVLGSYAHQVNAQETEQPTARVQKLEEQKKEVVAQEREALKAEVQTIMDRLAANEITAEEADQLKKEAAEKRALNIENRVAILDNRIAFIKRNGVPEDEDYSVDRIEIGLMKDGRLVGVDRFRTERKYDRRTFSYPIVAVGLNNAIIDGQGLDDSPYQIGGSRFFEIGWDWTTRILKESNFLRFRYGFSFQFNGLKPKDNQYFVEEGDQTVLEEFPVNLDKAKLRMDNLVIPLHLEFGPSKKNEYKNYIRYSTRNQPVFGIGGYAGVNLSTRQKLKYEENGDEVKEKIKADYNTSNFVYGLSAYVGLNGTALYFKYDLSPIFKDAAVDQHNVSAGLRFFLD
ncbi:hypothetical protein [Croceiramulus getboli]|nr:hypothetical protein P8624_01725 [Flavobacteriaceae bacterium YJPT1-3]